MTSNGSATYTYDAENHLLTAAGYTYSYDGDGNRVEKSNGSTGTIYWRDASGETIDEGNLSDTMQEEYIFFGGNRVVRWDVPTGHRHYYFSDKLGSADVVTSDAGVIQDESDYYPYGGEIQITNTYTNTYKFTGKERDTESGLDEFGARYYASSLGRFTIPDWADKPTDVPYAHFGNPQSLNLYSYVQNNPTTVGDPDGHADDEDPEQEVWENRQEDARMEKAAARADAQEEHDEEIKDAQPEQSIATNNNDDPVTGICYVDTPTHGRAAADVQNFLFPPDKFSSEPPQLKAGKEAHQNEEVRPGEKAEVRTPSGKRMDRYDEKNAHIREIKPDNARGERSGHKQLQNYKEEMDKHTGRDHTTELTKYKHPKT